MCVCVCVRARKTGAWEEMAISAVLRRTSTEIYHARTVQLRDTEGRTLWEPKAHACHSNVETWVRHSPTHKRVKGFLLQGPLFGFWKVLAHSLVPD